MHLNIEKLSVFNFILFYSGSIEVGSLEFCVHIDDELLYTGIENQACTCIVPSRVIYPDFSDFIFRILKISVPGFSTRVQ